MTFNIPQYPCNRGNPTGLDRGYHHFQASQYGVVCIFCGERGPEKEFKITHSNRTDGCPVCGAVHTQTPEDAHPSYYHGGPYPT